MKKPSGDGLCGHHFPLIAFVFFPELLQCDWEGGNAATDRWDPVIGTDPFLYESWHSLPHGTAGFLEGGNGFFSCCSLRWAECKLHPAWPLLKARPESSRDSLPSSSPLRSVSIQLRETHQETRLFIVYSDVEITQKCTFWVVTVLHLSMSNSFLFWAVNVLKGPDVLIKPINRLVRWILLKIK